MPVPFLRKLKRSSTVLPATPASPSADVPTDTVVHHPEHQGTMLFTITGVILAVLSLPFMVYGGDRTIRRLPRPGFVRSLSNRLRNKYKEDAELDRAAGAQSAPASPSHTSTAIRPGLRRAMTSQGGISRIDTGLSVASNDTYIRGPMTLEKTGLD